MHDEGGPETKRRRIPVSMIDRTAIEHSNQCQRVALDSHVFIEAHVVSHDASDSSTVPAPKFPSRGGGDTLVEVSGNVPSDGAEY